MKELYFLRCRECGKKYGNTPQSFCEECFSPLEVSYDYAGLDVSPTLGRTLFRPASMIALASVQKEGGFDPSDVSPEKAVAARPFAVLLICGTSDHRIPCRHSQGIYPIHR